MASVSDLAGANRDREQVALNDVLLQLLRLHYLPVRTHRGMLSAARKAADVLRCLGVPRQEVVVLDLLILLERSGFAVTRRLLVQVAPESLGGRFVGILEHAAAVEAC